MSVKTDPTVRTAPTLPAANQAQKDAKTRREKVLSVDAEKVELVHGRSGEWQRVYYALLDTGNANRCTISTRTG